VSGFSADPLGGLWWAEDEVVDFAVNVADRGGGASIAPGYGWK
jgi:hypothetical protein